MEVNIKICLTILLGYVGLSQGQTCRNGYEVLNQSCFKFATKAGDRKTYDEARGICQAEGADLLQIQSSKEKDDIVSRLRQEDQEVDRIWIGMKEDFQRWTWVADNSVVEHQGCYKFSEEFNQKFNFRENARGASVTPQTCLNTCANWQYAATKFEGANTVVCLCSVVDFKPSRTDAVSKPDDDGNVCGDDCPSDNSLKCGEKSFANRGLVFKVGGDASLLNNWAFNQPNNYDGYQGCMQARASSGSSCTNKVCLKFEDEKCNQRENNNEELGYICEGPSGVYEANYRKSVNWFEANYNCTQKGKELITIATKAKLEDVKNKMSQNLITEPNSRWWIGGHQDIWTWVNGDRLGYSFWANDQPNGLSEPCAAMYRNSDPREFRWEDINCNTQNYYICRTAVPTTTTTTTTTKAPTPAPTPASGSTQRPMTVPPPSSKTEGPAGSTNAPVSGTSTVSTDDMITTQGNKGGKSAASWQDRPFEENAGLIIAICVCGVAVLVAFIRLTVFCCQRKSRGANTRSLAHHGSIIR